MTVEEAKNRIGEPVFNTGGPVQCGANIVPKGSRWLIKDVDCGPNPRIIVAHTPVQGRSLGQVILHDDKHWDQFTVTKA